MPGRIANREEDELLQILTSGAEALTGQAFLQHTTRNLATIMNARYAFVCEYMPQTQRVRDLAFWLDGSFQEPGEYDIEGTPCELVLAGEVKCYPHHVAELFPRYEWLAQVGAQSYLAIPLKNSDGEVLGHMGVMDTRPLEHSPADLSVFQILGARVCAEMERKRFEEALLDSEATLSRVLGSAMDAIITMDAERRITFLNAAAERIFACSSAWALGQPFDRFLSRPLRSLLEGFLRAAGERPGEQRQMWAPEALKAVRSNREEFPVEITIASTRENGNLHYTLVLRDVNERVHDQAELGRLTDQNTLLRQAVREQYGLEEMVGDSAPMRELYRTVETIARADTTVLINGETGTGKELVAHAIHRLGPRADRLLIKMNCAALPPELIESELFGHEKGAFTGATTQRKGRFELADEGSIFLDEVGELSLTAQAKLLRVLQEQEFERVGGSQTIRVNVRVIAATNRDLAEMVRAKTFRADLYYRLNVFPVVVPPLRERGADVTTIARHLLRKAARKLGKEVVDFDAVSLQRLRTYDWPGNVRELQNVVERAVIVATGTCAAVPELGQREQAGRASPAADLRALEEVEAEHIAGVLALVNWVIEGKRGAASILGLEPSTLRYRMQRLGIQRPKRGDQA